MSNDSAQNRRAFLGTALSPSRRPASDIAKPASISRNPDRIPGQATPRAPLGPVKQIDAGLLNVGYVDMGPAGGRPVLVLHGWPYDINGYADVASLLVADGYRVIASSIETSAISNYR